MIFHMDGCPWGGPARQKQTNGAELSAKFRSWISTKGRRFLLEV